MINSKLIRLLSTFEKSEWNSFSKYLDYRLPREPQESKLFKYISIRRDNLNSKKLLLDEVRANAEMGFISKKNIQNIMSRLTLLIEEFLVIESLKQDQYEKDLRLFQIYNDRSLYGLSDNKADSLINNWVSNSRVDIKLYHYLLRLYHAQYFSENPIVYQEEKNLLHKLISNFKDFKEVYTDFYGFVNDHAVSLNNEHVFKEENYEKSELSIRILKVISSFSDLQHEGDYRAFEFLYGELVTNENISPDLQTMIFEFCERFLRSQYQNVENEAYSNKILEFYDFGMRKKIMLYKGSISLLKFQNIIQIACFLQEFDWASKFLLDYKELVPIQNVVENQTLALVQINCAKANYEEVIDLIIGTDIKTFVLKLLSRWYLLVCYYIIHDNHDFMDSQLNSFSQFVYYNKKRISAKNFESSINLMKIIKSATSHPKRFDLQSQIIKYKNIVFKNRLETFFEQRKIYKKNNNIDL